MANHSYLIDFIKNPNFSLHTFSDLTELSGNSLKASAWSGLGMVAIFWAKYLKPIRKKFAPLMKIQRFQDYLGVQKEIQDELETILTVWRKQWKPKWYRLGWEKKEKLLLIIDDLDRCPEERILTLLDSLRVMMDHPAIQKRVVVLIAVDERILRRAICKKYQDLQIDPSKNKYKNDENQQEEAATAEQENNFNQLAHEYMDKIFLFGFKLQPLDLPQKTAFYDNFNLGSQWSGVKEQLRSYEGSIKAIEKYSYELLKQKQKNPKQEDVKDWKNKLKQSNWWNETYPNEILKWASFAATYQTHLDSLGSALEQAAELHKHLTSMFIWATLNKEEYQEKHQIIFGRLKSQFDDLQLLASPIFQLIEIPQEKFVEHDEEEPKKTPADEGGNKPGISESEDPEQIESIFQTDTMGNIQIKPIAMQITPKENDLIKKAIPLMGDVTPRQIKTFYHRYVFSKDILLDQSLVQALFSETTRISPEHWIQFLAFFSNPKVRDAFQPWMQSGEEACWYYMADLLHINPEKDEFIAQYITHEHFTLKSWEEMVTDFKKQHPKVALGLDAIAANPTLSKLCDQYYVLGQPLILRKLLQMLIAY